MRRACRTNWRSCALAVSQSDTATRPVPSRSVLSSKTVPCRDGLGNVSGDSAILRQTISRRSIFWKTDQRAGKARDCTAKCLSQAAKVRVENEFPKQMRKIPDGRSKPRVSSAGTAKPHQVSSGISKERTYIFHQKNQPQRVLRQRIHSEIRVEIRNLGVLCIYDQCPYTRVVRHCATPA